MRCYNNRLWGLNQPCCVHSFSLFPVAALTLSRLRSTAGTRLTCPVTVSLDRYTPRTTASTRTPRRQNSSTRARGIRTRSQPGSEPPPPLLCWSGLYLRPDLDMTERAEPLRAVLTATCHNRLCRTAEERESHRKWRLLRSRAEGDIRHSTLHSCCTAAAHH